MLHVTHSFIGSSNSVSSLGDSTFLDRYDLALHLPFVGLPCVPLSGCSRLSQSS